MSNDECFFTGLILFIISVSVFSYGCYSGLSISRTAAIEAKAGRWTIDSSSGRSAFVYGCTIGPHLRDDVCEEHVSEKEEK